jgi:hypothetical protein
MKYAIEITSEGMMQMSYSMKIISGTEGVLKLLPQQFESP